MTDEALPEVADLPEAVRRRLIALSADALGALDEADVPLSLRSIRKFTPPRRARLGSAALSAALDGDGAFRLAVADAVNKKNAKGDGSAADELAGGSQDESTDASPAAAAAMAFLTRAPGWVERIASVASEAPTEEVQRLEVTVARLTEQLSALRAQGRAELDRVRRERQDLEAEVRAVRSELREAQRAARRAEERAAAAEQDLMAERARARDAVTTAEAELRHARRAVASAEAAAETARRADREGRVLADARLRLLLDVLTEATQGLTRELALPAGDTRPADFVEAVRPGEADVPLRGQDDEDPARLDALLRLPRAHLVVDGYNVTKTAYGHLPLEDQRARLLTGLSALAGQTGAEITCCFDGAQRGSATLAARGVRVLFTSADEIADDLIRRLVSNEPEGRPVVVVSSDREVADGVRATGARVAASIALLRRLDKA